MALFGIKKIEYCRANELAFSSAYNPFFGVASEPLNESTTICDLAKNRATLSIEQQIVSKQVLYTARLQFVTDADPMLAADYYAFVVTTNAGERILIGAQSRPRTMVTTAQSVGAAAGDLTAYTTTVEWQTNYRPVRLPMAGSSYTDMRQFDICCGKIVGQEPMPTLLTVIWQNYDGTELDRKTYYEGQPEPTTSVVPTKPETPYYTYTFDEWVVTGTGETVKVYTATFTQTEKELTFMVYYTTEGEDIPNDNGNLNTMRGWVGAHVGYFNLNMPSSQTRMRKLERGVIEAKLPATWFNPNADVHISCFGFKQVGCTITNIVWPTFPVEWVIETPTDDVFGSHRDGIEYTTAEVWGDEWLPAE